MEKGVGDDERLVGADVTIKAGFAVVTGGARKDCLPTRIPVASWVASGRQVG